MIVQWDNILDRATLSATNENSNSPVSNLLGNSHMVQFRADANNTIITASFDADEESSCLAIGRQNIDTMTVVMKDSAGDTLWSNAYTGDDFKWISATGRVYTSNIVYFPRVEGIREIEISIIGIGNVQIGGISTGVHMIFENVVIRPDMGDVLTGGSEKTRGGVLFDIPGELLETFNATLGVVELEDRDMIRDILALLGSGRTLFLDSYEGLSDIRPYLANMSKPRYKATKHGGRLILRNLELSFEECR